MFYLKSLSAGLVISIFLLFAASFFNDIVSGELFLHDALPHYMRSTQSVQNEFFSDTSVLRSTELIAAYQSSQPEASEEHEEHGNEAASVTVAANVVVTMGEEENEPAPPLIIGLNDVIIDYGTTEYESVQTVYDSRITVTPNLEALRNPDTLRNTMYIVEPRTVFVPELFDVDRFIAADKRVNPQSLANGDPVVLIFHTHSTEFFIDSDRNNKFTGIVGVGGYLANLLTNMGIPTIHLPQRFDFIDGHSHILGAYERQEPYIRHILEMHPTIEVVIDLHRDGLPEGFGKLLTYIDNRPTAQIMFFNGLSTLNDNGRPLPIATLYNPYLRDNLAFSFQMQLMANEMFDNFTRRIFLHAFRYSLHFRPKSLLIEVGSQYNTFQEAINAMYPLAEVLSNVIR